MAGAEVILEEEKAIEGLRSKYRIKRMLKDTKMSKE